MKKTLLIIKTGRSETFTEDRSSEICSLGDVFRTSAVIPILSEYQITWLTDEKALPLLKDHSNISIVTDKNYSELINNHDFILNLEKAEEVLELGSRKDHFYGFVAHKNGIAVRPFLSEKKVSLVSINEPNETFQSKLLKILDQQQVSLDYDSCAYVSSDKKYDIGLNWKVGPKWPEKALSESFWQKLEEELSPFFTISWQQGFNDLEAYKKWIGSCQTIITLDSLGLHLAVAMKKKVVALFGPTSADEIELFQRGQKFFYRTEQERETLIPSVVDYLKRHQG